MKVKDLNKKVLIPTFDLDNESTTNRIWKPKFYNSFQESDGEELVVDVAVRGAVPPAYFPTYQGFIDGGIAANNPAMAALCQAIDPSTGNQDVVNVRLLSIGTGFSPAYISGKRLDWGTSQWASFLIPIFIDSMMFVTNYECEKILQEKYYRLDSTLTKNIKLDDITQIEFLVEEANKVDIEPVKEWLIKNWQ